MQSLAILLMTFPVAQQPPAPPPIPLPVPRVEAVWDSRGTEQTDSNAVFDNQASLTARVSVPLPAPTGTINLFLNGSTKAEEFQIVAQEQSQITVRLKRVFRRGAYDLRAQFAAGKSTGKLSKPYSFRVEPPEPPTILAIYEGEFVVPFNVNRDPVILRSGTDTNIEISGALPGDEVQMFLQTKDAPEEIIRTTIEDKPVRDPIHIDLSTIMGLRKGTPYTATARIIRKGDASIFTRFKVQIGLKPDACDEPDY